MIIEKTSVFPASKEEVFQELGKTETLVFIARPFASFEPEQGSAKNWEEGSTDSFRLKLFGRIPLGTHTIRIVKIGPDGISSREGNRYVPVWNHDIYLEKINGRQTRYTDRVEIHAGWKTPFVWLWATAFYAHRQKKWIRLLSGKGSPDNVR